MFARKLCRKLLAANSLFLALLDLGERDRWNDYFRRMTFTHLPSSRGAEACFVARTRPGSRPGSSTWITIPLGPFLGVGDGSHKMVRNESASVRKGVPSVGEGLKNFAQNEV